MKPNFNQIASEFLSKNFYKDHKFSDISELSSALEEAYNAGLAKKNASNGFGGAHANISPDGYLVINNRFNELL